MGYSFVCTAMTVFPSICIFSISGMSLGSVLRDIWFTHWLMVSFPIFIPVILFLSDTPMKMTPPLVLAKATKDSMHRSSNFSLNSMVSDSPVLMRSGRFIFGLFLFQIGNSISCLLLAVLSFTCLLIYMG